MPRKKLCPGKSKFLDSNDLQPAAFRRLVARRARTVLGQKMGRLTSESRRKKLEESIQLEAINLSSDFLPARFLTDGSNRSEAVCRITIRLPNGTGFGTGFLIADNVLMTNNHVLEDEATAARSVAEFGFQTGTNSIMVPIEPDRLFITHEDLDFTIVGCDSSALDGVELIPLLRNPATVTRNEPVNIIQHPDGRPKEVALTNNLVTRVRDTVIRYETDTEPGSSGSPVFNNSWELTALHHAGISLSGGRAENEGIRISAIVNHLLSLQGTPESRRDEFKAVLDRIPDTSPFLGFFDAAGLGALRPEVELPDFSGTPDFADVGVWNIEHFNRNVSAQRVNNVADVVARLALDVFGLVEVEKPALEQLVDELQSRGFAMDFKLLDVSGSQDIAVLFDRDTSSVKLRPDIAERNVDRLRARTPAGKTAFPRFPVFAECRVADADGADVHFIFIVVHLKAFGDAESRARRRLAAEKIAEIIDDIRVNDGLPVILGGDFNDRLNTDVFAPLQDSPDLFALTADDASTDAISFVGDSHRSLIDHIVVSSDIQLGEIMGDDAAIIRLDRSVRDFSDDVSDHVPIVFRMILRDEPIEVDTGGSAGGLVFAVPPSTTKVRLKFENEEGSPTGE